MLELETQLQELEAVELFDDADVQLEKQRKAEMARRNAELKFNEKRNEEWRSKLKARKQDLTGRWRALGERRLARNEFYHALISQMSGATSGEQ